MNSTGHFLCISQTRLVPLRVVFCGLALHSLISACGTVPEARIKPQTQQQSGQSDVQGKQGRGLKAPFANTAASPSAQALYLGDQIQADLLALGLTAEQASSIRDAALKGTVDADLQEGGTPVFHLNFGAILPGFLKGAFQAVKAVVSGNPFGVVGGIVESVVKAVAKKPADFFIQPVARPIDDLVIQPVTQKPDDLVIQPVGKKDEPSSLQKVITSRGDIGLSDAKLALPTAVQKSGQSIADIPAMAFEILLGLQEKYDNNKKEDLDYVPSLLAAAKALGALPQLSHSLSPESFMHNLVKDRKANIAKLNLPSAEENLKTIAGSMLEKLVVSLSKQKGVTAENILPILEKLQENVQNKIIVGAGSENTNAALDLISAALDGQYRALLSGSISKVTSKVKNTSNKYLGISNSSFKFAGFEEKLVVTLIQSGSKNLVEKLELQDESLKQKLEGWMLQIALKQASKVSNEKKQSLVAAVQGFAQDIITSENIDRSELAEIFLQAAKQLDPDSDK